MNETLMLALANLHEELDGRYDGAPDSTTLWMGEGLTALKRLLDSEEAKSARIELRKVLVHPQSRPHTLSLANAMFNTGSGYTCNGSPRGCEGDRFDGCQYHKTGKFS